MNNQITKENIMGCSWGNTIFAFCIMVIVSLSACKNQSRKGENITIGDTKNLSQMERDSLARVLSPVQFGTLFQELHLGNGTNPSTLDPHIATGVPESKILNTLLEGLVSPNPQTLEPEPAIAESWTVSRNQRVFTFTIGKDRKWSNGDPITAEDVRWSWERLLSKGLGSEYVYMLFPIENAERFHKGKTSFDNVGIKVLDERTVEVTTKYPTPFFPKLLTHVCTYPVHKATFMKYEHSISSRGDKWTQPEHFVSSGPFLLKTWENNKKTVVEKNPNYWDHERVKLNKIHFYPIEDENIEEKMYRSGQLHITSFIPKEKINLYREKHSDELLLTPYLGTYYYRVNVRKKVFKKKLVRQALSLAIDRKTLVETVTKNGEIPAFSYTPPKCGTYTSRTQLQYNPTKAKELMEKAGYPNGKGFPKFTILYNDREVHKEIALAIGSMWKKTLGIEIELISREWKVYLSEQRNLKYEVSRAGWIGDYADPNTFLDMFVTQGGNNQTGWRNKKYDRHIRKASVTSGDERYEHFQQAEAILLDEMPIIPIYYYTKKYIKSPSVKGWYSNVMDRQPFKYVYLSDDNN